MPKERRSCREHHWDKKDIQVFGDGRCRICQMRYSYYNDLARMSGNPKDYDVKACKETMLCDEHEHD